MNNSRGFSKLKETMCKLAAQSGLCRRNHLRSYVTLFKVSSSDYCFWVTFPFISVLNFVLFLPRMSYSLVIEKTENTGRFHVTPRSILRSSHGFNVTRRRSQAQSLMPCKQRSNPCVVNLTLASDPTES